MAHLKRLRLPAQPSILQFAGVAAMIRASKKTANSFTHNLALCHRDRGDEQQLGPLRCTLSSFTTIAFSSKFFERLIGQMFFLDAPNLSEPQTAKFQHYLAVKFYELSDFCLLHFFSHRLTKFVLLVFHDVAVTALQILQASSKVSPPIIIADVLKLSCNGWCVANRFGDRDARCLFCSRSDTPDLIEHLISGHVVLDIIVAFGVPSLVPSRATVLGTIAFSHLSRSIFLGRFLLLDNCTMTFVLGPLLPLECWPMVVSNIFSVCIQVLQPPNFATLPT
jgi:hypothetical protein